MDSNPISLDSLRSGIEEIRAIQRNSTEDSEISPSEEAKLLNDYALQIERMDEMLAETSEINSLSTEDLEEFTVHLKKELSSMESENAKIEKEIEELSRRNAEEFTRCDSELEGLSCSLDFMEEQRRNLDMQVDYSAYGKDESNLLKAGCSTNLEILELSHQIEKSQSTLKSLQDLDSLVKRFEVVEKIEDAFSGLKVVEFEGNSIRLSLRTYMPNMESISFLQKVEDLIEPLEQNHELLLELVDGTMDLRNAEIFPNDVYIGEIVDVAKSFRHLYSSLPLLDTVSSLEWFVRRVQDRIVICTLRHFVVKCANKSRHSFEYLDRDEIIVAHMVGGIDAFMKMAQGWPISSAVLTLLTLKSSSNYSKDISLSFLCKVVDLSNSLEEHQRHDISSFADCIEEILLKQMRAEGQPDDSVEK
ncbi:hypothetical protein ACH5RR_031823 [Cinchona calisaya]|uniref:FRIGIDA-like protein n=1 Tax=Cinchona calisaya TaxID=153742 RepID=A0ABD2YIA0_9GENT